jgi:universal stress protein E
MRLAAAVDPALFDDDERQSNASVQAHHVLEHHILASAHDLACKLPAEFHVMHSYEPLATGMIAEFDTFIANYSDYREAVKKKHQQALDKLLHAEVERSCIVHFEEGSADVVLADITRREGFDIVVLGTVARSGLDRVVIGSTAERLLDNLDCDLLILRH